MADLEIDPAPMVVILNVLTVILPPDKALSFKLLIIVFVLFCFTKEMTHKFRPQIEKWELNVYNRHVWISCQGHCVIVQAERADPALCSM